MNNENVSAQLDQLLADYSIYAQKMKNFHWNVRGKRFFQLHDAFEGLYDHAAATTDTIAERLSRIGQIPTATLQEYAKNTRLEECFEPPTAEIMVRDVVRDIEKLNAFTRVTIKTAAEVEDVATQNILEDLVRAQEENAWMMASWLQERPGR